MTDLPDEDVQSYPRPPLLEPVPHRLRILVAGAIIAETTRGWRVCETHHPPTYYLPQADIDMQAFRPSRRRSWCEWKGQAAYFDLVAGPRPVREAAWTYPAPTPGFAPIRDHLAVYPTAVDGAWVGDVRVTPQPGDFYGGWVTPNLTGRIKGGPGTLGW